MHNNVWKCGFQFEVHQQVHSCDFFDVIVLLATGKASLITIIFSHLMINLGYLKHLFLLNWNIFDSLLTLPLLTLKG